MSLISNIHTAFPYDAKKSKPYEGQRLVKTIAKADKDGNYGPHLQQTMCTSVPVLVTADIDWSLKSVQEVATEYFKTVQNDIVSERIKSGVKDVADSDISMAAIVDYLFADVSGASDKWTSERVASWFEDYIAEGIATRLLELGVDDETMARKLAATQKRFAESLSSRGKISAVLTTELNKALAFSSDKECAIYKRFYSRLNPKVEELSLEDSLGF